MRRGLSSSMMPFLLAALGMGGGMAAQMPTVPTYANPYQSSGYGNGRSRRRKVRTAPKGAHDFSGMGWRK